MVVAIFENADQLWFFKVSGPVDLVSSTEPQWREFINDIKFESDEPKWELPDGWSNMGDKPMRHATFAIGDSQPPLEFVVSSLSADQDMLLNLNRWRRQINLSPAIESDVAEQLKTSTSDAGDYLMFDQIGTGSGQMRPPFAGNDAAPAGAAPTRPALRSTGLTFDTPEGWTAGRTSAMVPARLSMTKGDSTIEITIVKMPSDINEWAPNVKRWVGQVELGKLTEEQLAERTSDFKIDGIDGKLIDLVDPDSPSESGMIAGMVKQGGSAWFIKLSGDKQLVEDSRAILDRFIQSMRFQ